MLTVAETGSLSVPLVSNHDVASPLRYPGGKSVLSGYVASLIDVLGIRDVTYVEPYAKVNLFGDTLMAQKACGIIMRTGMIKLVQR